MKIDTHQHFWNLSRVEYSWLTADFGPIYRTFEPPDLEPLLRDADIDRTVLVQSANSYADTEYMLEQADRYPWIGAVIGWVPLLEPDEAATALERGAEAGAGCLADKRAQSESAHPNAARNSMAHHTGWCVRLQQSTEQELWR